MATTGDLVSKYGKKDGVCLEVGVGLGDTAVMTLTRLTPVEMTLVDCYRKQPWNTYPDDFNAEQKIQDDRMQTSIARVMKHAEQSGTATEFHRMTSLEFATKFEKLYGQPPRFDFIFLDANHSFEAVAVDLSVLWPLLRTPGAMLCHDYCRELAYYGVIEAVDEFVGRTPSARLAEVSDERFPVAVVLKERV